MKYTELCTDVQNYMNVINTALLDKLEDIDKTSLDLLAMNLQMIYDAKAILAKDGIISYNDRGNPQPHPAVKILNDAQRKALEIMREYGLTALARKRLKGVPEKEEINPLIEFINEQR